MTYQPKKGDIVEYNGLTCRVVYDEDEASTDCTLQWIREEPGAGMFNAVHISQIRFVSQAEALAPAGPPAVSGGYTIRWGTVVVISGLPATVGSTLS